MNFCAITRNRFLPFPLVVVVFILCLLSSRTALLLIGSRNSFGVAMALTVETRLLRVSEQAWRAASQRHADEIRNLLSPGLIMDPVPSARAINPTNGLTALDPKHPVYNFLIEYYGLKGNKGTRRLARWTPNPRLLLQSDNTQDRITRIDELMPTSNYMTEFEANDDSNLVHKNCQMDGILLEGGSADDLGGLLHLKGAIPHKEGIIYSPSIYFRQLPDPNKVATPYIWYRSVLQQTLKADPVLYCHGMHEWAMQYWPMDEPPPPSGKYQQHLSLRVSREVLNAAVERRGISCTHVDALRYFAPAAGPLNHHGYQLERRKQLELEQPACVHAHMDLLKIALKLGAFCDPCLLVQVLEVALMSRTLDIAASPYDVTAYGIAPIPVETTEGRVEYRQRQVALMGHAAPIRRALLQAYDLILALGFDGTAHDVPTAERYAKAEPGGLPWRKNLLPSD